MYSSIREKQVKQPSCEKENEVFERLRKLKVYHASYLYYSQ